MSRQLALYKAGSWIAARLSVAMACRLAEESGRLLAALPDLDGRRALAASHMRRVLGPGLPASETRRLVGEVFANYSKYWAESLKLPSLSHAEVSVGMSLVGNHHLEEALSRGKGVILAPPHLGGWEWGAFYLTGTGLRMTVAVEPLHPPDVFDWFTQFRRRLGMNVVPTGSRAAGMILSALRNNEIVCLLADRLIEGITAVDVEFFGAKTRLPAGPVTLALRSGAPLLPAAIYYGPKGEATSHTIVFRPPLQLSDLAAGGASALGRASFRNTVQCGSQLLARELEELIKAAPTQWHMVQPNWPDDPPLRERR